MKILKIIAISGLMGLASACSTLGNVNDSDDSASGASAQPGTAGESIEYRIMVQRATQAAIWAMPAVALVDFKKATRRDLKGDVNQVVYLRRPLDSKHGFLTANDVTAYGWGTISTAMGPIVIEVPAATDKVSYFGSILNAWQQPIVDIGPSGKDE
ncbi:MAG: DUF1254 domain-containing protein, partial [Deltaproteobacteria bacterium]|nr:DUF1254 domain-containing protein [Deltaproteobacteria bacterium]